MLGLNGVSHVNSKGTGALGVRLEEVCFTTFALSRRAS